MFHFFRLAFIFWANDCLLKALWWSSHWPQGVSFTAPCHFFDYEQEQNVHNQGLPSSFIKTAPGWRVQYNNNNNNPVVAFVPLFWAELTLSWRRTLCQKKKNLFTELQTVWMAALISTRGSCRLGRHHSTVWLKESYCSAQGHVLKKKKKTAIISLLSSTLWLLSLPLSLAPPLLLSLSKPSPSGPSCQQHDCSRMIQMFLYRLLSFSLLSRSHLSVLAHLCMVRFIHHKLYIFTCCVSVWVWVQPKAQLESFHGILWCRWKVSNKEQKHVLLF